MSQAIRSRRCVDFYIVCCCVSVTLIIAIFGLTGHAERYLVGDLQLIGWENVQDASATWSGPVEAATLLAWYAAHGYSWILPDLNEDGFIDEKDTAGLANILGRVFMNAETSSGTTDPALVWGIGAYLAEVAGGRFGLRVYDSGFADEWTDYPPGHLRPDEIPGVAYDAWNDPTLSDYRAEMAASALTILGLTRADNQHNTYVAGRSLNDGAEESAIAGIGLVSPDDDPCRASIQGRIIDTVTKSTTAWWIRVDGLWYEVEFMLALWETEPESTANATPAPDLVTAVESSSSCEDSSDENGVECTIQWSTTITNNNPEYHVPRAFKVEQRIDLTHEALASLAFQYVPSHVEGELLRELNETGRVTLAGSFVWSTGLVEILDGAYEISVLADARCEIDESSASAEANNGATTSGGLTRDGGESTSEGPLDTEEGCPDLVIEIVESSCEVEHGFHSLDFNYTVTVTARVTNQGNLAAGAFWVWANGTDGVDVKTLPGLAAGESTLATLSYEYTLNMGGVTDVVDLKVDTVRSQECNTSNNSASTEVCD